MYRVRGPGASPVEAPYPPALAGPTYEDVFSRHGEEAAPEHHERFR
jgi:hypothetical protein